MDNDKFIEELRKYCDPYSLLVISDRRLMRVRCPFKVRVLLDFADWKKDDVTWVEKVMVTRDLQMVYVIGRIGYSFFLFQILLDRHF